MKKFIAIFIALISVSAVFAKAKPRSLKANAEKVNSAKAAAKIAENYGLSEAKPEKEPRFGQFLTQESYVATGENDECILYVKLKNQNLQEWFRAITFSYSNVNGSATSKIEFVTDDGNIYLLNTSKLCELDSGTHYMTGELYNDYTTYLAEERQYIKLWFMGNAHILFKDKINEEQVKTTGVKL
ncbi:MAG: hypothetical protein II921_07900 [Treponema sp.]|nr:hypothetical protein [Treponema sp.]